MTKYVVINNAPDGRHISCYSTLEKAQKQVLGLIGNPQWPFLIGRTYYSDWGNAITIEERPDNWTQSIEKRMSEAFDARECGTATSAQLALLDKHMF